MWCNTQQKCNIFNVPELHTELSELIEGHCNHQLADCHSKKTTHTIIAFAEATINVRIFRWIEKILHK